MRLQLGLLVGLGMLLACSPQAKESESETNETQPEPETEETPPEPADCTPQLSVDHVSPSLSHRFQSTCAGCHGEDGLGQGIYPSTRGISLEGFIATARAGRPGRAGIPAFDETRITDEQLLSDYAALTGQGVSVPEGCPPFVAEEPEAVDWDADRISAAKATGLSAWRTLGYDGAACANCHGPAPYILAAIGYSDGNILRRGMLHLDSEKSWAVVDWIAALRAELELDIAALPKPMDFRPLQPGGVVIEGDTPAERDHNFGLQLAAAAPTLVGDPIREVSTANQALEEYLAIDARTFPIGILFNRYSEDGHHGSEHASLREWLPDHHVIGVDEAAQLEIYDLHDAWLADPSWENFYLMEQIIDVSEGGVGPWTDTMTRVPLAASSEPAGLAKEQYRSVYLLQHLFRLQAEHGVHFSDLPSTLGYRMNGPWTAADEFRTTSDGCWYSSDCGVDYDPIMVAKLDFTGKVDWNGEEWDIQSEKEDFMLPWFWVGTLVDQGMAQTFGGDSTLSTEYLTVRLYDRQMYNHLTFLRFKKNLAIAFEESWPGDCVDGGEGEPTICYDFEYGHPEPQTIASPHAQEWSSFLAEGSGLGSETPEDEEASALYQTLLANSFRMMAYTIIGQIETEGWADGVRDASNQDVDGFGLRSLAETYAPFFNDYHGVSMDDASVLTGEAALDAQMLADLTEALHEACEAGYSGDGTDPWPGHCEYEAR